MSYGFKFYNDSSELVIDDELVKPWFAGRATFASAVLSTEFPQFSYTHPDGVTRQHIVYKLAYTPPTVTGGVFYISLPSDQVKNKAYTVISPFYTGNNTIYVYAAVDINYVAVAADIPEVYCFSLGQITDQSTSGYGAKIINSSNQCVFDTGKTHLKIEAASKDIFDRYVQAGGTGNAALTVVDYPCYLLPFLETEKLTYIDSSSFTRQKYVTFYNQFSSSLLSWSPAVLTETKSGLLPFTGSRQFNHATYDSPIRIVLPDSTSYNPLYSNALTYSPGYNGGAFPTATYTLSLSPTTVQEGLAQAVLATVTTTNIPSGAQLKYTLSGTNVTASDFSGGLSGVFTISNGSASFSLIPLSDGIYESDETVTVTITTVGGSALSGTPQSFTLKTSNFFTLTSSSNNVNEGDSFTITLQSYESTTTTRVMNYTLSQVPSSEGATDNAFDTNDWAGTVTLGSGATITANRFTLAANTSYPSTTRTFTTRADSRIDGPKKIRIALDEFPTVYTDILINDTSQEYSWTVTGSTSVSEGNTYTYNVTTNAPTGTKAVIQLLYSDPITATLDDLAEIDGVAVTSGSTYYVSTTNGTGSFTLKIKADLLTEGVEYFYLVLDKDMATPRTRLAQLTSIVTIADTSTTPVVWTFSKYSGDPSTTTAREGTTFQTRTQSTNVVSYPISVWYKVTGTGITLGDTGLQVDTLVEYSVPNSDQLLNISIAEDYLLEGTETFNVKFYRDSAGTDEIGNLTWNIVDAISVTRAFSAVVEGNTQVLTISPDPSLTFPYTVYGKLSGSGITASDFVSGSLLTTTTFGDSTPQQVYIAQSDDLTVENSGSETVTFTMYSDVGRTVQVGNVTSWSMVDPTYLFSRSSSSIQEGNTQVISINTDAVLPKTFYGTLSGTNVTGGDFSTGSVEFEWTVSSMTANYNLGILDDSFLDGTESVTLKFYKESTRTNQLGNTLTWSITDADPKCTITATPSSQNEGSSVAMRFVSTNIASYPTTIYYTVSGSGFTTSDSDFNPLIGSFSLTSSDVTYNFLMKADNLTEGNEYVTFTMYSDSARAKVMGSVSWTIIDTSWTIPALSTLAIYSGGVPVTQVPRGATYYARVTMDRAYNSTVPVTLYTSINGGAYSVFENISIGVGSTSANSSTYTNTGGTAPIATIGVKANSTVATGEKIISFLY